MANQYSPTLPKNPYAPSDISIPPAKRQRLSPTPGQYSTPQPSSPWTPSPNAGSPTVPYLSLPGQHSVPSFHTPQPFHQPYQDAPPRFTPGAMGPPERPADKPKEQADKATDVNDLSDVVTASGIDLKAEENYLLATYRNRQNELSQTTSFGAPTSSTISPTSSFRQWSQGSLGSQPAFHGAGPLSQPVVSQKTVEDEVAEKHRQAARRLAETGARHLQSPFLNAGDLRGRINYATYQNQVRYRADGRESAADPPRFYGTMVLGAEGVGIVEARGTGVVTDRGLEDILSLMSLATETRLRDLVEDAVGTARSRRYGSHGQVPPEWSSLAIGNGQAENTMAKPQSLTSTAWDAPAESMASPVAGSATLKQSESANAISPRLPTPPSSEVPPQSTVTFRPEVAPAVRGLGSNERQAEQKRIAARKRRADKEEQASADATSPATPGGPGTPGTPATSGSVAPEPKLTKKEREKQAKQVHQTDEVMRQQANQTAALALGGKSKYSWMTTSSTASTGSGFGTGAGAGRLAATGKATSVASSPLVPREEDRGLRSRDSWKVMGDFREDGPGGKAVQLRDVVVVLERDGRLDSKSLTKAYSKLKAENPKKK